MENTTTETETFDAALARFVAAMQQVINDDFARNFPRNTVPQLEYETGIRGQKYVRVCKRDYPDSEYRSAWCFVEIATGNVLKCDGWKRPAKGVRGSIYSATVEGYGCTSYGPHYNNR